MSLNETSIHLLRHQFDFTVDNTVNNIVVGLAGIFNIWDPSFATQYYFQQGDNLVVKKMKLILPYCFQLGDGGGGLIFFVTGRGGGNTWLPVFDYGQTLVSNANQWTDVNSFVPFSSFSPLIGVQDFIPTIFSGLINVSMIGAPDSLNGLSVAGEVQLLVESNFEVIP